MVAGLPCLPAPPAGAMREQVWGAVSVWGAVGWRSRGGSRGPSGAPRRSRFS